MFSYLKTGILPLSFLLLVIISANSANRKLQTISPTAKQYLQLCRFVNEGKSLSSSEFKLFDDFNSYRQANDKTYFEDALRNNQFNGNYYQGRHFSQIIAIPLSIALLIFILFWVELPCVCCSCCIRKHQKCRRDPVKKPYTPGQVACPITWCVILGVITFIISIFGNQTNSQFVRAYDFSTCQLAQLHKETVFGLGNSTYTWTGTSVITSQVNSVSAELGTLYSQISNTFGSNVDFASNGEIQNQLTTISDLFSTTAKRSINTDPATGNSLEVPYFGDIGSAGVSGSKVGNLDTQRISIIGNNLTAIVNLKNKAEVISGSQSSINSAFSQTATSLGQLQTQVSLNGQNFLHQQSEKQTEEDLLKLLSFSFFVCVSIFLCIFFVGIMLVKICGISCCRALIHIGWISFTWLAIAGLLLSCLIIITRFAMQDFCQSEATLITSSNISQVKAFEQSASYFNDCLDSSTTPGMADNLQIASSLTLLSDLNSQNTEFSSTYTTSISANAYTTLTALVTQVTNHITSPHLLLTTQNGVQSSQSWNQAMNNLLSTTNTDCSSQSPNDEFVGQSSECTFSQGGSLGTPTCIVVPNFSSTSTRYDSCTNSGNNIKSLIQRAQDSLSELNTKLNSLKNELDSGSSSTDLQDKFQSTRTSRENWLSSKYSSFNTEANKVTGAVYLSINSVSGLVGQFECGWLGSRYDAFSSAFCTKTKYNFGTVVVIVFIISILCFVLSCCGGCMAIRISAELKQKFKYMSFRERRQQYAEESSIDKMDKF